MILGTDVRLESPNPTPFIYQAKWKTWPHSYTSHIENWPHSYTFFENWPHSYTIFSNFTLSYTFWLKKIPHLIYFWCKNDTHSYTGRPQKYTPFQPHICIYLYNGSYPPVDIFKYLKISSNKLKISSNIWRYLQMNWRYLQMNWRYLQMN